MEWSTSKPTAAALSLHSIAAGLFVLLAAATLSGEAEAFPLRGCNGHAESSPFDKGSCRYGWEVDACGHHVSKRQTLETSGFVSRMPHRKYNRGHIAFVKAKYVDK